MSAVGLQEAFGENQSADERLKLAIRTLIDSPEKAILMACKTVKKEMFQEVLQGEEIDGNEASVRLREMEEAFTQFTRIRKLLKDKQGEIELEAEQILKTQSEKQKQDQFITEGKKFFRAKRYEEALQCFEKAMLNLQSAPEDVVMCAATAAFYAKRLAVAQEYVEEILFRKAEDVQALVLKALIFIERDKYDYAFELLTRAKKLKPSSALIETYLKKVIKKLRTQAPQKLNVLKSNTDSQEDPEKLRKWKRAPFNGTVRINSMETGIIRSYPLQSLSAGGCLVAGANLPDEFQLNIELRDGSSFWAYGNKVYDAGNNATGVAFKKISREDERLIDECVKKRLR